MACFHIKTKSKHHSQYIGKIFKNKHNRRKRFNRQKQTFHKLHDKYTTYIAEQTELEGFNWEEEHYYNHYHFHKQPQNKKHAKKHTKQYITKHLGIHTKQYTNKKQLTKNISIWHDAFYVVEFYDNNKNYHKKLSTSLWYILQFLAQHEQYKLIQDLKEKADYIENNSISKFTDICVGYNKVNLNNMETVVELVYGFTHSNYKYYIPFDLVQLFIIYYGNDNINQQFNFYNCMINNKYKYNSFIIPKNKSKEKQYHLMVSKTGWNTSMCRFCYFKIRVHKYPQQFTSIGMITNPKYLIDYFVGNSFKKPFKNSDIGDKYKWIELWNKYGKCTGIMENAIWVCTLDEENTIECNDSVTILIDFGAKILQFYKNDKLLNKRAIKMDENETYYPCVEFSSENQQHVEFELLV
eukprot:309076_1